MKNIKFIFAALVSIAALSCNKLESPVEYPESNQDSEMMTLTLSAGEPTKTYIANGTDIYWHSGDKIKVYSNYIITDALGDDASAYDFSMSGEPQGNFARFTGKVRQGTKTIWAVYPSALAKGANVGGVINVNLPSTQTASENSFSQNLNVSVAKTDVTMEGGLADKEPVASSNVAFHNACALLKFTVPSDITNIKSVVISADQNIAGNMTINYSGDSPVLSSVSGSNAITMDGEGTFTSGKDYYFVLAPVVISELSIYVNTSDGKQYAATKEFQEPMQLKAGKYKSLGTLNLANMPSFSVGFDVDDDDNYLNGTNVIFAFPTDDISDLKLTVSKGEAAVRTISKDGPVALNDDNQYISSWETETVTTWPYLPKGTYMINGTYKAGGKEVKVENYQLKIDTDPKFTVGSLAAKTSYTEYKSGNITAANQFNGTSIEVTASNVNISPNILSNQNYKDLIKVQFANPAASGYGTGNLVNGLAATLTNQQYGKYESPSYVFDGKAVPFADVVCHVTGIPYALAKKESDEVPINKWAGEGGVNLASWTGNNGIVLGGVSSAHAVQKSFHIPANTNVSVKTTGSAPPRKTSTITVAGTKVLEKYNSSYTKYSSFDVTKTCQFTNSMNVAEIHLSDGTFVTLTVNTLEIWYAQ